MSYQSLLQQIRAAKAEVAHWDEQRRAAVVLQGPREVYETADNVRPPRDEVSLEAVDR